MGDANFNYLIDELNSKLKKKEKEITFYKRKYNDALNKLQEKENELNIYRIQLQDTKNQVKEEKNSKNELNRKLTLYKNKSLNQTAKINSMQTDIDNLKIKNKQNYDKIINYLEEIKIKDDEIKNLNLKAKEIKRDKLITITFTSAIQENNIVICHSNDIFSDIAEKLFQKYPSLIPDKVYFLYEGKVVEKNKSVLSNDIKDNSKILIVQND